MGAALVLCTMAAWAQKGPANGQPTPENTLNARYAQSITARSLRGYLSVLASDSLEGRETGQRGQKMAANYIKEHFKANGLTPISDKSTGEGYYQRFTLEQRALEDAYLKVGKQMAKMGEEMLFWGSAPSSKETKIKVQFIGNGQDLGEDANLDGKAIFAVAPGNAWRKVYNENPNAKVLIFVNQDSQEAFERYVGRMKNYIMRPRLGFAKEEGAGSQGPTLFFVSPNFASKVLNKSFEELKAISGAEAMAMKPIKMKFKVTETRTAIETENVLGFLEGTDKKDEVIVVTSHYDHLGKTDTEIFNGADDDGSGTSGVMALAAAFGQAKADGNGPRRSILFMTVTGEEKGLLGSEYYTDNPLIPLENTVTNLNIDMIGRLDEEHLESPDYVYVIGSDKLSTELHELSEAVNEQYTQLDLDYRYNDENDPNRYYYRSDHYNFAKNNIPVIFYFNGTHPDYHQSTDTIEKIEFDKMTKITRLVFYTAWELANRDNRVVVDKAE